MEQFGQLKGSILELSVPKLGQKKNEKMESQVRRKEPSEEYYKRSETRKRKDFAKIKTYWIKINGKNKSSG